MPTKSWTNLGPIRVRLYTGEVRRFATLDDAVCQTNYRHLYHRRQNGRLCIGGGRCWHSDDHFAQTGACELLDELGFLIPDQIVEQAVIRNGVRYTPRWKTETPRSSYRRPEGGHKRAETARQRPWRRKTSTDPSWHNMAPRKAVEGFLLDEDVRDLGLRQIKLRRRCLFDAWDWQHDGKRGMGNYDNQGWKRYRRFQYRGE